MIAYSQRRTLRSVQEMFVTCGIHILFTSTLDFSLLMSVSFCCQQLCMYNPRHVFCNASFQTPARLMILDSQTTSTPQHKVMPCEHNAVSNTLCLYSHCLVLHVRSPVSVFRPPGPIYDRMWRQGETTTNVMIAFSRPHVLVSITTPMYTHALV